ncbi:MAG TPA: nucleotide exchange factor GrpE [Symbiobacteriaceae bacterium]|nr:nucleotide exchange factor GrpE [Symbiobacteriaceae bacterium]
MAEEKKPSPQELEGDGLGDAQPAGDAAEAGADAALEEAKSRAAELENRLYRAQAEFENYRRRVAREKEDLAAYANQRLILSLLPVLDNLERALATPAVPGDEKFRQGVELTARSFREILSKEGLTPIEAVGQPFDPNFHEAVMTVDSPEHDDETVLAEFQKGYRLGERVIRPSMVQVSKKG